MLKNIKEYGNVGECGSWDVDGGWMPLPTCPQRYCDPASLVSRYITNFVEFRAIIALRPLPNRPRLSCRVSGLVYSASALLSLRFSTSAWSLFIFIFITSWTKPCTIFFHYFEFLLEVLASKWHKLYICCYQRHKGFLMIADLVSPPRSELWWHRFGK